MGFTELEFEFQSAKSCAGDGAGRTPRNLGEKEEGALVYDSTSGGNISENVGAISCNQGLSRA